MPKFKEIEAFAIPFDNESADFLYDLGIKPYKACLDDISNIQMLKRIAKKGIQVILLLVYKL